MVVIYWRDAGTVLYWDQKSFEASPSRGCADREMSMSERSFALTCVGLALAFGLVVPEPGPAPRQGAVPADVVAQPAPRPGQQKEIDRLEGVPFAANHAAPVKQGQAASFLWTVRHAP